MLTAIRENRRIEGTLLESFDDFVGFVGLET